MYGSKRAFTLVELLVVMAIMAALAAVTVVSIKPLIERRRILKASVRINEIKGAVDRFHIDYQMYPWNLPAPGNEPSIAWEDLCRELDPSNPDLTGTLAHNTQLKQYVDFGSDGREVQGGAVVDPWGNPYRVYWNRPKSKVVVWSLGPDGEDNTGDDVSESSGGDGDLGDDVSTL